MKVTRRLADVDELTIFRAFPDLETAEVVVLHEKSRQVLVSRSRRSVSIGSTLKEQSTSTWRASARARPHWWLGLRGIEKPGNFATSASLEVDRIVAPYRDT